MSPLKRVIFCFWSGFAIVMLALVAAAASPRITNSVAAAGDVPYQNPAYGPDLKSFLKGQLFQAQEDALPADSPLRQAIGNLRAASASWPSLDSLSLIKLKKWDSDGTSLGWLVMDGPTIQTSNTVMWMSIAPNLGWLPSDTPGLQDAFWLHERDGKVGFSIGRAGQGTHDFQQPVWLLGAVGDGFPEPNTVQNVLRTCFSCYFWPYGAKDATDALRSFWSVWMTTPGHLELLARDEAGWTDEFGGQHYTVDCGGFYFETIQSCEVAWLSEGEFNSHIALSRPQAYDGQPFDFFSRSYDFAFDLDAARKYLDGDPDLADWINPLLDPGWGGPGGPGEGGKLIINVSIPPDARGQVPPEPADGEPYKPWQGDTVTVSVGAEPQSALPPSTTVRLHDSSGWLANDLTAVADSTGTARFSLKTDNEVLYDLTASASSLTDASAQIEPKRLPLIFLPGIQGSYLGIQGTSIGDIQVWPNVDEIIIDNDDDSLNLLKMNADGISEGPITVMKDLGYEGVIKKLHIDMYPDEHYYDHTIDFLSGEGYLYLPNNSSDDRQRVFPLGYDWRASASDNEHLLAEKIASVGSLTGAPRVTVIAHSQGGLVLRAALADGGVSSKIFRAATLGTPYLGAPKFMTVVKLGWPCLKDVSIDIFSYCIINRDRAREISVNMPGANDLLPSAAFVSKSKVSPVYIDPNLSDWPGVPATGLLDASQYPNFLGWRTDGVSGTNYHLTSQALEAHSVLDSQNSGKVLRIVGRDRGTIGGAYLWADTRKDCHGTWPFETCSDVKTVGSTPTWTDGDGTVPLVSSIGLAQDGLVEVETGETHMGIAQDFPPLLDAIQYLQVGAKPLHPPAMNRVASSVTTLASEASYDFRGTELQVLGSAEGRVRNSQGRVLGTPLSGDSNGAGAFDSDAFVDTGSALSYFLHDSGAYEGKWLARSDGDVVLRENANENGTITSSIVSLPFHVAKGATFSMTFSVGATLSAATIAIDDNSDGVTDRTVPFSTPVSGDSLSDRTGPTVTLNVQHLITKKSHVSRVTVTATDGGSGVAGIEYRVPATGQTGTYSTPLTLPEQGEIFVRAVDKAGNWSVEQMATLDDRPGIANLVTDFKPANFTATGYIGYDRDVDFWGFSAKNDRYSIKLDELRRDYDLRLYSKTGELIASSTRNGTRSERISVKLVQGSYYIAISSKPGQFDDDHPYRLEVKRREPPRHGRKDCGFPQSWAHLFDAHRCVHR